MGNFFGTSFMSLLTICYSAAGIYIAVIVFTRIAGKRSFSKMSSFDFAITIAIGSIIGSTILSASVSLLEGGVGLAAVFVLQVGTAILRRFKFFHNVLDNSPLLLMNGTEILEQNMLKARVTKSDLRSKLREANVIRLSQVRAVVFETTGDISVLHTEKNQEKLEDWLLKDVQQ